MAFLYVNGLWKIHNSSRSPQNFMIFILAFADTQKIWPRKSRLVLGSKQKKSDQIRPIYPTKSMWQWRQREKERKNKLHTIPNEGEVSEERNTWVERCQQGIQIRPHAGSHGRPNKYLRYVRYAIPPNHKNNKDWHTTFTAPKTTLNPAGLVQYHQFNMSYKYCQQWSDPKCT